jgi:hypothetical protein
MTKMMSVPKRIVLSRKGFDSSAGGCASPILNGEMISLPIPEHNSLSRTAQAAGKCPEKHLTYRDLEATQGKSVAKLVAQLTKGKIKPTDCVHLDPDIRPALRYTKDAQLPLTYGQDNGSQTELSDLRVGDLFLFFGWFRDICQFVPGSFRFATDGVDVHAIWGWLQIAERLDLPSNSSRAQAIASHHPHISHPANRNPNCLYVAGENLTFFQGYGGAGTFSKFHDGLRLSDKQTNLRSRKRLRSNWRLPAFFKTIHMTHHSLSDWELVGEGILGRGGAYPGQEFVFKTEGHEKQVAEWLEGIFSRERQQ